jgi:hypothetical protein
VPSRIVFALALCPLVLPVFISTSCRSPEKQRRAESTPTESAAPTTVTEEDTEGAILQVVRDYEYTTNVTIDRTVMYRDSSGAEWVRFDANVTVHICVEGPQAGPTGPLSGIMTKPADQDWELVNLGVGDVQCGVPTDVQTALGFDVCSASEEELDRAIKDWLLSGPAVGMKERDLRVARKTHYTDSYGTEWVAFCLLSVPDTANSAYGIMKRIAGGNWQGVNVGSAAVECGLPEEAQTGLGFPYCPHG